MVARVTTAQQVFVRVRDAIVSGELEAGSQHSIYALAAEFGVSRTPVRDAMLRLADSGLVSIERNRGVRIRGLTVQDVRNIFELRLMIEVPAAAVAAGEFREHVLVKLDARLTAMRAAREAGDVVAFFEHDRGLHDDVIAVLGNPRATHFVEALRDSTQIMGASTLDGLRSMRDITDEHIPVIEAIKAGDPAHAAQAMADHLVTTGTLLMTQAFERGGGEVDAAWADRLVPFLLPRPTQA